MSLRASYAYSASTCSSFRAPRLGATAGPLFLPTPPPPPPRVPVREVELLEYVESGRSCSRSRGGGEEEDGRYSKYVAGTRPVEREVDRTVIQPEPSGRRRLVRLGLYGLEEKGEGGLYHLVR
jgi:hypothetical protein